MQRVLVLAACALMAAGFASADVEGDVMGLYQGGFTGDAWQDRGIEAKVIARGKTRWQAAIYVTGAGVEPVRVTISGTRDEGAAAALFEGEADLGEALGGTHAVRGQIEAGRFTGEFTRRRQTAAFVLEKVFIEPPTLGAPCPDGGTILFDGSNADAWVREPEKWCLTGDSAMQVCGSGLRTRDSFGSARYHIEFQTPFMPDALGQARGNSGVYVLGMYEVQVLDSFGLEPMWDFCGGIYKVAAPLVNASLPPLQWQTYDIEFHAARFNEQGEKVRNARITVVHNGVVIHDNLELPDRTPGGMGGAEAAEGPLYLQDHGDAVKFRNIWVQPIQPEE
jgi:hypothetical protein